MKPNVEKLIISADQEIKSALERLNLAGTGTLFVVDRDDKICGVITDGDIRRALLKNIRLEDKVTLAMNRSFVAARHDDITDEFLQGLHKKISYIPILNSQGNIIDYLSFVFKSRIPIAQPKLGNLESVYVNECLTTNWISSQGRFVKEFEKNFAGFCGVKYAVATSNGTTALHLALECLGIGPGDEVIVPSLTFVATANAVKYTGATPVFVDSELSTWNISPDHIKNAITKKTRAIIPVHLLGQPARMDEIMSIARRYNLFIIEDAAQAHGAQYKNQKIGSIGDISCFSFFGNKILTTGEGGMLLTNDAQLNNKARILRDHGMSPERKYWHPVIGFNYRLTNLQAAIGCAQLERIEMILESKSKLYEWYSRRLKGFDKIILPPNNNWSQNVYWMFSILINPDKTSVTRDEILKKLDEKGVEGRPLFIPIHMMPPYDTGESFETAQYLSRTGLSLPSFVGITEKEVDYICNCLLETLGENIND